MTQDDIRSYLAARAAVRIQIAAAGDGSPEMAWGDTFCFALQDDGEPRKMPFVTIVIKDYAGFDAYSKLDRGGLYRLNLDIGKEKFEQLFSFAPKEIEQHRDRFDFTAIDRLFPHPAYAANGWASIINPSESSRESVEGLLDFAIDRASRQR